MVFDFIYHEHLSAFSVKPIQVLFERVGLELVVVERVPTKGGSLRYFVQRPSGPLAKDGSVAGMLALEDKMGLYRKETFSDFADKVSGLKKELLKFLAQAKSEGKSIAGFGASITGTTLVYHFEIGEYFDYLVDDNLAKQGLFSPGLHLPVLPSSALYERKPDYVVILAWRFADPFIKKNRAYIEGGGCFVIPVPEFYDCQMKRAKPINTPVPSQASSELLYGEIFAHYRACGSNAAYLSDTWADMLKQRGALFPLDTMARMLELGNRVNAYIDDFNFLIDATALLASDPVAKQLLAAGEPEFGHPRRDCRVDDKYYSSNFVHHVLYAGRIITAIEERGIVKPRILEIGGGLGGLAYLLKAYFGDWATYYVADLPEGLVIQEWYLRHCLPDVPSTHKASKMNSTLLDGGFNFINAYVLDSQDFHFDVAINVDSMQEMNSTAITGYLTFIERNISEKGIFYFQNHYGQASSTITEPSEYPLDGHWTVRLAEIAPQIECCTGAEQARIIYYRTTKIEDVYTRRLVLRTLWNGFISGKLPNNPALVAELVALPAIWPPKGAVEPITAVLVKRGVPISLDNVAALQDALYFPGTSYVDALATGPAPRLLDVHVTRMDALWRAQSNYIKALKAFGEGAEFEGWLCGSIDSLTMVDDVSDSEFYSAYYASILFMLGKAKDAEIMLTACVSKGATPLWLVRFADLLTRFGKAEAARPIIDLLKGKRDLDWFAALKAAELSHDTAWLEKLDPTASSDDVRLLSYAKTAARLGEDDTAFSVCAQLVRCQPEAAPLLIRGVLVADPKRGLCERFGELLGNLDLGTSSEEFPMALGVLLLELGRRDEALQLIQPQVGRFWDNYFRLGQLGRFFQQTGLIELADKCLNRSIELRPGAFLHFDFVGNTYFSAGRFDLAAAAYSEAVRFKPYLRLLLAKKLYSVLPAEARSSGAFGKLDDLRLMFQRDQDFYHDLGPAHRRS